MEHSIPRAARSSDQAEGILARRIALAGAAPVAHDAQVRVTAWLADIADQPAAAALMRLLAEHPAVRELLAGFSGSAPYLWDLVRADPARLATLLQSDPEARFALCSLTFAAILSFGSGRTSRDALLFLFMGLAAGFAAGFNVKRSVFVPAATAVPWPSLPAPRE